MNSRILRTFTSAALSAALVALSAGLAPYEALAQVVRSAPVPVNLGTFGAVPMGGMPSGAPLGAAGDAGALNASGMGSLGGLDALNADSKAGANLPANTSPSPLAGEGRDGGGLSAEAKRPPTLTLPREGGREVNNEGMLAESAAQPLPEVSKLSDSQAKPALEADFFARIGQRIFGQSAVQAASAEALAPLAAKKSKEMPESPRKGSDGVDHAPSQGAERGAPFFIEDDGASHSTGPDEVSEGPSREGGSELFTIPGTNFNLPAKKLAVYTAAGAVGLLGLQLFGGLTLAAVGGKLLGAALTWGLAVLPSLTLHEWGHAKAADLLGDRTARAQGRVSMNLLRHLDPVGTVALPLLLMLAPGASFMFGWAKPVPVQAWNFKNPDSGMAKTALAGPAVNIALALLGAALYRLSAPALGVYGLLPTVLALMVDVNLTLALFNLLPLAPFDGHHIFRRLPVVGRWIDRVPAKVGMYGTLAALALTPLGGLFMGLIGGLHHALLFGGVSAPALNLAGSWTAGLAALGTVAASGPEAPGRKGPPPVPGVEAPAPQVPASLAVDYIVELPEGRVLTQDASLAGIDANAVGAVNLYKKTRTLMFMELAQAGLGRELMRRYDAAPLSIYRRISMATLRVDADKAAAFKAELEAMGCKVHENRRISLPKPVEQNALWPWSHKVGLDELQKVINAEPVHKILEGRFGRPDGAGPAGIARRLSRLFAGAAANPEVPVAVIDSGADTSHPHLQKAVKKVVNVTSGENVDDIGHGTHVTDTVRSVDPWQRHITVYKTFQGGSANTDDILRALTAAGNDGNIIMSNSWGDSEGDPNSPEAKLVAKLAAEGRIMVFAAGNEGSGANTIGAPAIVTYLSPETGAPRVVAVAAADFKKVIAGFSSRGPGSGVTEKTPGYPNRPDITAMGVNLEAAWPAALGKTLNAISGTSMATPNVAGAISLLARAYGVTAVGAALDKIAKAVVDNAQDLQQPASDQGRGFLDVHAAYLALEKAAGSAAGGLRSSFLSRAALKGAGLASSLAGYLNIETYTLACGALGIVAGLFIPVTASFGLLLGGAGLYAFALRSTSSRAWVLYTGILGYTALEIGQFALGAGLLKHALGWFTGTALLAAAAPVAAGTLRPSAALEPPAAGYADALEAAAGLGSAPPVFMRAESSLSAGAAWAYEFELGGRLARVVYSRKADGSLERSQSLTDMPPAPPAYPSQLSGALSAADFSKSAVLASDAALAKAKAAAPEFKPLGPVVLRLVRDRHTGEIDLNYFYPGEQNVTARVNARTGKLTYQVELPPAV